MGRRYGSIGVLLGAMLCAWPVHYASGEDIVVEKVMRPRNGFEPQEVEVVTREALVILRPNVQQENAFSILSDVAQLDEIELIGNGPVFRVRSRSLSAASLVDVLSSHDLVESAGFNYVLRQNKMPDDALFRQQWGLLNLGQPFASLSGGVKGADVGALRAWERRVDSSSVTVAVLDSGVDDKHPDITDSLWSAPAGFTITVGRARFDCPKGTHGVDIRNTLCLTMDSQRHGTNIAGVIGATTNNGSGIAGLSWRASIAAVVVLDGKGLTGEAEAAQGVYAAMALRAADFDGGAAPNIRVVSISLSTPILDMEISPLRRAIAEANDLLFVAAAGNVAADNDQVPEYPASLDGDHIISVTASNQFDKRTPFTKWGRTTVDLAAPGFKIRTTEPGGGYAFVDGSSIAVPFVSGGAALLMAECPQMTAVAVRERLLATVDPLPAFTETVSGGRLNIGRALHQGCQ